MKTKRATPAVRVRKSLSIAFTTLLAAATSGATDAASLFAPSSARQIGFTELVTNANGEVEAAYGRTELVARSNAQVEALFRNGLGNAFAFGEQDAMKVASRQVAPEGNVYYRLQQTYQGLPVWRGEMTVQTDASGKVNALFGAVVDVPDIDIKSTARATESIEQALQAHRAERLRDVGRVVLDVEFLSQPSLSIYTEPGREPVLAWDAMVTYHIGGETFKERAFIDVRKEAVIVTYSEIKTVINRNVYDLAGGCTFGTDGGEPGVPPTSQLPGPLAMTEGGTSPVAIVRDNYHALGHSYWFFRNAFQRDSFNGQGAVLDSTVNAAFPRADGTCPDGDNAFWTGSQMVLGEGGSYFHNLALNPDVTYHELGHAVTQYTSNLVYARESGAMNEATSDIYAAAITAWMNTVSGQPGAVTPMNFGLSAATWTVGEGLLVGSTSPLRDMRNPALHGGFNTYSAYLAVHPTNCVPHGGNDACGVHTGSGIGNLMFYLLAAGGMHPDNQSKLTVTGIGMGRAVKYVYEANALIVSGNAGFSAFRNAMMTRARANGSVGACDEVSIAAAWTLVGVSGTQPSDPNACTPAFPPDGFEVDDTRPQWKALYEGLPHQHTFHRSNDSDWVAFAVGHGTRSRVTLAGAVSANASLKLYRQDSYPNGNIVLVDQRANVANQMQVANDAGENVQTVYYVEAKPTSGTVHGAGTQYTLSVSVELLPDQYEPDNVREDYTALYEDIPQVHNFHATSDHDWVAFAIGPNVLSRVTLQGTAAANATLQMYQWVNYPDPNASIQLVATSANQAQQLLVEHRGDNNPQLAVYYVRAMPSNSSAAALHSDYTLQVDILP